jgi:hypothetical protein
MRQGSIAGFLAAALGLILCVAAGPGFADSHEGGDGAGWNQGRVTAIAEALADEFAKLKDLVDRVPPDISFSQQRAQYELQETLRLLENTSAHLARELKAGKGREATRPTFRRVEQLRADAEEEARRTLIPEEVMDQVFATGGQLLQLQPYYRKEEGS